jgi:hypothetical protein
MGHKPIETAHFNQFLKLLNLPESFEYGKEPEPDFVIKLIDETIGIEHTRLFIPKDIKGDDPINHQVSAKRILTKAEQLFKLKHTEKLTVTVRFHRSYGLGTKQRMLTGKDVGKLSKFLCDFVSLNIPEYGTRRAFEQFDMQVGKQVLPDEIDYLSIYHKFNCWTQSEGGVVPDVRSDALYNRVASKDTKPQNYKTAYNEIWLLIVEDQWNMTTYFDFSYAEVIEVDSMFNKVFILRSGNDMIIECKNIREEGSRWKGDNNNYLI